MLKNKKRVIVVIGVALICGVATFAVFLCKNGFKQDTYSYKVSIEEDNTYYINDELSEGNQVIESSDYAPVDETGTGGTVATFNMQNETVDLNNEDIAFIQELWNTGDWNNEGASEGLRDCVIIIDNVKVYYNSDKGVFDDVTNQRFMVLDADTKEFFNGRISEYIELGEFD